MRGGSRLISKRYTGCNDNLEMKNIIVGAFLKQHSAFSKGVKSSATIVLNQKVRQKLGIALENKNISFTQEHSFSGLVGVGGGVKV